MSNTEDKVTNEVIINGEVELSTRKNTVTESTLGQNETAQDKTGHSITGKMEDGSNAYKPTDPLSNNITDEDYIPFYDVSEQKKHNTLFSKIIDRLKGVFLEKSNNPNTSISLGGTTIDLKMNNIDASLADNNVTSVKYPSTSNILDKAGRIMTRFESVVNPNGKIGAKIYVRNYNSNGDIVAQKGMQWHMDKSGKLAYQVDDYNAFREAIKTTDQIGVTIPNKSNLDNYKTAGTYAVTSDASAQTMFNIPASVSGKLIVSNNGDGGYTQFYVQNHEAKIFTRTFWNNAWSAWSEIGSGGGAHTYQVGITIPANSDFNDYTTEGVYHVVDGTTAESISNIPNNRAGKLVVSRYCIGQIRLRQSYYVTDANCSSYMRLMDNDGTWYSWEQTANSTNAYIIKGGVVTGFISVNDDLNNYTTAGTYDCRLASIASSLSNCPVTDAFKMMVDVENNPKILTQTITIIHNLSSMPWRRTKNNSDTWSEWRQFGTKYEELETTGTLIPDNSDLNDYKTFGKYYTPNTTTASTLSNAPAIKGGFTLYVMRRTTNQVTQFILMNSNGRVITYYRNYDVNSSTWSDWCFIPYSVSKTYNNEDALSLLSLASNGTIGSLDYNRVADHLVFDFNDGTAWAGGKALANLDELVTQLGTEIPANSDFNDYTTAGVYRVGTVANAETISNIPVALSGKLIVGYNTNDNSSIPNWKVQFYISNHQARMFERVATSSDGWLPWVEYSTGAHTYELGTDIPANSDLNTYTTEGVYRIAPDATAITVTNIPQGTAGKLIIVKGVASDANVDKYKEQFYLTYTGNIYKRYTTNSGSSWSEWTKMATTSDITPAQVGNGYAVATVSGSTITATITGFQLRAGVIVVLLLPSSINVNSTLNISNTGAKSIYMRDDSVISKGTYLPFGINTFMYDGTYYRHLGSNKSPSVDQQNYVADTSGSIILGFGYDSNLVQIKNNLGLNKLRWNYYKNSAWRGDVNIADYDDIVHQTLGTDIPDNANFDDYTTNGIYRVATNARAQTISNIADEHAGKLIVMRVCGDGYPAQFYITYTADSHSTNGIYWRTKENSTWKQWLSIPFFDKSDNMLSLLCKTTTADDKPVGIRAKINDTTTGKYYERQVIKWYQDHQSTPYGFNMVTSSGGAMFIGSGEAADAHYAAMTKPYINEFLFLTSDGNLYIQSNGDTIANRKGFVLNTSHELLPCLADAPTNNVGSIGNSTYKLANVYTNKINGTDVSDITNVASSIIGNKVITTAVTSLDNIALNTAGTIKLGASISPTGAELTFLYICYGSSQAKTIEVTRYNHASKNSEEFWKNSYQNDNQTWTGWLPLSRTGTYVGTCTTAADQQKKVATVDGDFSLKKGVRVGIKYSNTNTYNATASSLVTLNVNSTGDKVISHTGATAPTGTNTTANGRAGRYTYYIYDGTYWVFDGSDGDNNSTNYLPNNASGTLTASGAPYLNVKSSSIDLKQSNNNVSSTQYPAYIIQDKNGYDIARLEAVVEANGQTRTYLQVCNYNTSSSAHFRTGIAMYTNKSQDMWYSLSNPSYFARAIGFGVGTCDTAEATTAKTSSIARYVATTNNGIVSIKFTYAVPAGATLNINSQGAKSIYYRGAAIKANVIKAGDLATFVFFNDQYLLLGIDRTTAYDDLITGTGTAAQDKGSGVTNRYVPAKWTFDTGRTATAGDIITIKIPVAGHDYGVFVSVDNGTNYIPVALNGTARLTTHFPINQTLQLVYEPDTTVNSVFPVAGGDARVNITGVWRVLNYRDNDTVDPCYLGFGYATCATAEATAAKVATLSNYTLRTGGYVSVKFTYAVPANATLNINSRGAKNIYYRGAAIKANIIRAGDIATFIYSGQYHLVGIDREERYEQITSFTVDSNFKTNASAPFVVLRLGEKVIVRCDCTLTADYTVTSYGTDILSGLPTYSNTYYIGSAFLIKNGVSEVLPVQIHRSPTVLESVINKTIPNGTAVKMYLEYMSYQ